MIKIEEYGNFQKESPHSHVIHALQKIILNLEKLKGSLEEGKRSYIHLHRALSILVSLQLGLNKKDAKCKNVSDTLEMYYSLLITQTKRAYAVQSSKNLKSIIFSLEDFLNCWKRVKDI